MKVTKAFWGVPDGQVSPAHFQPGDDVVGDLARVAAENGWAKAPTADPQPAPAKKAAKAK